ncbi:hypothetical protein MMC25_006607 [Agyrium rufum]|nr:hypothetical protein [Agyrium rufum]
MVSSWYLEVPRRLISGLVKCLQIETAAFGIKAIILEPGYQCTNVFPSSNIKFTISNISEYETFTDVIATTIAACAGNQPGDPKKPVQRIVDVLKDEGFAAGKLMPPVLPVGPDIVAMIRQKCKETLQLCDEWDSFLSDTNFDDV